MNAEQEIRAAKVLLENPIWKQAWIDMQKDMFVEFCDCCDLETRQRISMAMDLLSDFRMQVERKIVDQTPLKIVGDNNGS